MKYLPFLCLLVMGSILNAQNSYFEIIEKASKIVEENEDSLSKQRALQLYEIAFEKYPDSIDGSTLYEVTLLANDLKEFDKGFKYLTPLSELEEDKEGYPGWDYILGDYAETDYQNLMHHPRWKWLEEKAVKRKKVFFEELKQMERGFFETKNTTMDKKSSPENLYIALKNRNVYKPKSQQNYSITFAINDSIKTSYYIHLPKDYNPDQRYPMLVVLHGAVRGNKLSEYQTKSVLGYWNRFYTKYADINEVILIFPSGSKQYNWMAPDDGFQMVPEIIRQIKKSINIEDNSVFVSGHSNGATGSFSYLMKQPTLFAGFYGLNTHPKVYTGGTFIENILNRSFVNFSTDQDYYYPPNANDSLNKIMKTMQADYKDYRFNGFPHWFPQFDESEQAYEILFSDLVKRQRNPFPEEIIWEFDDNDYGNIDWLSRAKLDTLIAKATWHNPLNFKINKWLFYANDDELIEKSVDSVAFGFPRKSGKIKATFKDNVFHIETSRIKSFNLNISPEMVDLNKKIKVYVNGKLRFKKKMTYDKTFMLTSLNRNYDRKQLWVNQIEIKL